MSRTLGGMFLLVIFYWMLSDSCESSLVARGCLCFGKNGYRNKGTVWMGRSWDIDLPLSVIMAYGVIWFAFFDFQRHSEGLNDAVLCCPLINDAMVKILRSKGFLLMHQSCFLRGYWVYSEQNKSGLTVGAAVSRMTQGGYGTTLCA